jgi:DNA-binding IclR family transcriptional regulator
MCGRFAAVSGAQFRRKERVAFGIAATSNGEARRAATVVKATNSLERILAVFDVFSGKRLEWTPDGLMAELGYSRPTLYRYLKMLKKAGFLTSSRGGGYTLGPRVVELDYLVRQSDPLVLAGAPVLRDLAARRPCTALLARWYGNKILCVASECSAGMPLSSHPRGRPMPLGRGAISRSIMAHLPRAELTRLINLNLDELRLLGLGETSAQVLKSFAGIKKTGFAVAFGEITPGAVAAASAILDEGGKPVASCCVVVAGGTVSGAAIDSLGEEVRDAAGAVSSCLREP